MALIPCSMFSKIYKKNKFRRKGSYMPKTKINKKQKKPM